MHVQISGQLISLLDYEFRNEPCGGFVEGILLGTRTTVTETKISDGSDELTARQVLSIKKFVVCDNMFYDCDGNVDMEFIRTIVRKSKFEFVGVFRYRPNANLSPSIRDCCILESLSSQSVLGLFTSNCNDFVITSNYCLYSLQGLQPIKLETRVTNLYPNLPEFDYEDVEDESSKDYFKAMLKKTSKDIQRLEVGIAN